MHIVTRLLSVIAMCCCAMASVVVAADGEKKLFASKQAVSEEGVETLDIRNIERLAENGFFALRGLKGPHKKLYQVFDGETPIRSELYVLTHADSYLFPNAGGYITWLGRYYLEPAINGKVEKEYGPQNLYVETFPVGAIEERVLHIDGRVVGMANDGSTKLHVVWRIGKPSMLSLIKMPKKTGVVEKAKAVLSKLFTSKK